jgi:predicted nucleic acid-binding protein
MARLLIDTGPVVRQLRGHQPTIQLLRQARGSERLTISAITRLEVRARMHEYERYDTQKLLSRFLTYSVSSDIADLAGDLIAHSRQRSLLSVPDAVIAATALLERLTLVTYNVAHFAPVRGLRLYSLPQEE